MVFWFKSYKRGVNKPFSLWNFPLHIPNSGFSCLPQTKQVPEGKDSWEDADMGWRFLGLICQLCSLVWAMWYTAAIYQAANSEAGVNPVLNENFPVTSWCSSSWCSSSARPPHPQPATFGSWMYAQKHRTSFSHNTQPPADDYTLCVKPAKF